MAYKRKTRDVWELRVNYGFGHGWETECSEPTRAQGIQRRREYRENCPEYPVKLVKVREPIQQDA